MKRNLLTGLFLLATWCIFAQSDSLGQKEIINLLLPTAEGVTIVKTDRVELPTRVRLEYVDADMQFRGTREVSLLHRGIPAELDRVFAWNDRLNVLSSFYYPGPKKNHVILQQFDYADSLRETYAQVLSEAYLPEGSPAPVHQAVSPDSSMLLIVSWELGIHTDPTRLHLLVFDQKMQRLRDERVLLPYTNDRSYLNEVRLLNDGTVVVLFENYTGKLSQWSSPSATQVERFVLTFAPDETEPRRYEIKMPEKHLPTDYLMDIDRQGRVVVAGFYRHQNKEPWAGAFWHRLGTGGNGMERRYFPIGRDALQRAYGGPGNKIEINRHAFTRYRLDHLLISDAGEVSLLAERHYAQQSRDIYRDGPGEILPDEYFDDILIVRIDERGRLKYTTRLPKQQKSPSWLTNRMSYQATQDSNRIFIVYNDLPENYRNRGELERLERFENERDLPVMAEVYSNGGFRFYLLNQAQTPNYTVRPEFAIPLGNRKILFYEEFLGRDYRYLMTVINIQKLYPR